MIMESRLAFISNFLDIFLSFLLHLFFVFPFAHDFFCITEPL